MTQAAASNADKPDTDSMLRLELQLCFALYATSRAVTNAYRPLLSSLNLTYPQYLVMLVRWERGGLTVGELGSCLYLDTGTLTPLLKRLERQGLITRTRSQQDERQVHIALTADGQQMRKNAESIPVVMACRFGLSADRKALLRRELRTMLQTLLGS